MPRKLPSTLTVHPYMDRGAISAKEKIVSQMADDMRVLTANQGYVTSDDLILAGWKQNQIDTHSRSARERAFSLAAG